jgi:hypothetical protein
MRPQPGAGFVLYVDGKATSGHKTLDASQRDAQQFMPVKSKLQIISYADPAPSQTWNYDYTIRKWVASFASAP